MQLTAKQHAFLEFIAEHVRRTKVWPTYREIVDHFGYRSPNSVTQNLQALEKKGFLDRDDHGYRLIGQRTALSGGFPVQGALADGQFEAALSVEELSLNDLFPGLLDAYAVRAEQPVHGVEVQAGDYILIDDELPQDGVMVVAIVGGEAAVCRVLHETDSFRLQYSDGKEARYSTTDSGVRILGPYVGHINRRGLFRLPVRTVAGARPDTSTTAAA
jgi:repressor LexA